MAVCGLLLCGMQAQAQIFSPTQTVASEGAAQAVTLSGQVSVLRDSQPWALYTGNWVHPQQVIVTGSDGRALFRLPDGSTFEVYPNSTVTFRRTQGNCRDLLEVWLGRVKVHIQRLGGQPNPNRIQTPTAVISVRGTVFDIVVEEEDDATVVTVEEGEVAIEHARLPSGFPKYLNAGDSLRVVKNEPIAGAAWQRGNGMQRAMRLVMDVLYQVASRMGGVPGLNGPLPGGRSPGPAPLPGPQPPITGDTGGTPPPPPPPPPPPM